MHKPPMVYAESDAIDSSASNNFTSSSLRLPDKSTIGTLSPPDSLIGRQRRPQRDGSDEVNGDKRELKRKFEALAAQFTSLVLTSTFAATLIVSFLSLANDMIGKPAQTSFQVGLFLCLIAAGVHLSLVLVAGRSTTIAFHYSKFRSPEDDTTPEEQEQLLDQFYRCRELCETMQFAGSSIFVPGLSSLVWCMFDNMVFPLVLYTLGAVGGLCVYVAGYWRLSIFGIVAKKPRTRPEGNELS